MQPAPTRQAKPRCVVLRCVAALGRAPRSRRRVVFRNGPSVLARRGVRFLCAISRRAADPVPCAAMRVALIHDWLTGMRGGERVLEALCEMFPDADLFTLVAFPDRLSPALAAHFARRGHTSFVQRLPFLRERYRYLLPLFPRAVESFDLRDYDLVVSSSHCVAKGARAREGAVHVAYIHTPMRYAWGTLEHYFGDEGALPAAKRRALAAAMGPLRTWDRASSRRVHTFVANSRNVAERIHRCYEREAAVIYPPVDIARFRVGGPIAHRDDFYLVVSALVPYKRVDLAVRAANDARVRLVVVGEGPDLSGLRRLAGPTVELRGRLGDFDVADLYARARAVVFPGVEDFGLVPVEAMASGTPVVAFRAGGATETVIGVDDVHVRANGHEPTGIFFDVQSPGAIVDALASLERHHARFDPAALRHHASRFDRPLFLGQMRAAVAEACNNARGR